MDRCTTPDGLGITLYDFGGDGEDLILVHATGFCAEMYGPLARGLADGYHCWGLDLRGHGRSDRPADGNFAWSGFATDVLAVIDHLGLGLGSGSGSGRGSGSGSGRGSGSGSGSGRGSGSGSGRGSGSGSGSGRPSGFGHSCGGAALLLAEQARPGTFGSLFCFEPVVLPAAARAAIAADNPLSAGARRRREVFPSASEALANFSSKPPFAGLDPEVLALYVEAGFEPLPPEEGGDGRAVRLRCRREDEAVVYAHGVDHDAFDHLPEVECPVALCCGQDTDAFGPRQLEADAARLPRATVEVMPGLGHFGPLEDPARVAGSVLQSRVPGKHDGETPRS
jgi:pimeloyl-ACP methyl ester carboxylesterase